MDLDHNDPDHWGRSPLTERALRLQQLRAEQPDTWEAPLQDDLDAIAASPVLFTDGDGTKIAVSRDPYYFPTEDEFGDDCPDIVYYIPMNERLSGRNNAGGYNGLP